MSRLEHLAKQHQGPRGENAAWRLSITEATFNGPGKRPNCSFIAKTGFDFYVIWLRGSQSKLSSSKMMMFIF